MQHNENLFLDELKDELDSNQFKRLASVERQKIMKKTLRKFKAEVRESFNIIRKSQNGHKKGFFSLAKFSRRFGVRIADIESRLEDFDYEIEDGFIYINKKQNENLILSLKKKYEVKPILVEKKSKLDFIINFFNLSAK